VGTGDAVLHYSEPTGFRARDYRGYRTTRKGDTLIKHQPFEVETLTWDNVFGTLTRVLGFTWASRGRPGFLSNIGSHVRLEVIL